MVPLEHGDSAKSRSKQCNKLLANMQAGGDNLVDTTVEGLQGRSRFKITDELRRFIEVDDEEAVKIGELERNTRRRSRWSGPSSTRRLHQMRSSEKGWGELTRECCAFSSTPPIWWTIDGDHRVWTKIGTQFAWTSTEAPWERSGRTCITSL